MNCRGWDHLSQYSYTNTDILNPSHDKLSKYFYLLNHGQHADLAGLNDIKVLRDCENVQVWSRLLNKIIYCTCSDLLWWTRNCHQRFLLSAVSGVNLINTINNVHTSCLQWVLCSKSPWEESSSIDPGPATPDYEGMKTEDSLYYGSRV